MRFWGERAQSLHSLRPYLNQTEVWLISHTLSSLCYFQVALAVSALVTGLFGCGTMRKYGFKVFQPPGNFSFAASSERDGTMITSSPSFQFTGVATLYLAVNCSESITRRISSKLRPVLCG